VTTRPAPVHTGLRSPEVRSGLRLLAKTFVRYPRPSTFAVLGAFLWMVTVVAIPFVSKTVIDDAITGGDRDLLVNLVILLVGLGAVQALGIAGRRYFGFQLAYRADADLRNQMFEHMQRLAFSFHDQTSTGQLMARSSSDLSAVRLTFAMLPITAANLTMLSVVVTVLVLLDPVLGVTAGLTFPLLLLAANGYAKRVMRLSFDVQERLADLSQVVEEAIAGIQVVKAYGQHEQENAQLDVSASAIFDKTLAMAKQSARFAPLFELIPALGTLAVLWLGGIRVVDGHVSPGEFVAFLQYLAVLVFPIRMVGFFFAQLPRAAAAGSRVQELLATDPEIRDPEDPRTLPPGPGTIRFHDVDFAYNGGPLVLEGTDVQIPGGTAVALVGSTAAGKTTLAHLIPRFHDVGRGSVTVDGVDVRDLTLDELRREVALVFQETFLFSASIADNIAVGDPGATPEQIRAAARLAQAHDFICQLPDGYNTEVGERGLGLSGGQRQRVALARAVLRDPRILILDDATSSVDAIVESEIQAALRHVMTGRTTVIIAHRTSTLALVDSVVFLEGGRIVATGTHQELLATVPRYAEVLASQYTGEAEPVAGGEAR
jgi:ATP-binding cassette subfamily B protein